MWKLYMSLWLYNSQTPKQFAGYFYFTKRSKQQYHKYIGMLIDDNPHVFGVVIKGALKSELILFEIKRQSKSDSQAPFFMRRGVGMLFPADCWLMIYWNAHWWYPHVFVVVIKGACKAEVLFFWRKRKTTSALKLLFSWEMDWVCCFQLIGAAVE